ncbi:MAG TPA: Gfo/Idh/MocA family oxidoreductase, partial [Isosphaeraceae bacterium]|nr:Gfo/Idh/MocA family oxidoreductase [Isosphaeraceae bacterium]
AKEWAQEFSIPKAYGSYEALIADPEIDAVYIPLPNELHKGWTFAAADAGKHILCEKPLAIDAEEAAEMVAYCQNRNVVLMEAFMWRHQPRTKGLLDLIRRGAIGEVRLVRSSFSFPIDMTDWRLDAARGGGALWDVGCYGISTTRLFAGGEPTAIEAQAHFGPSGVDLSLTAALKFPNDVLGLVDCSFEQPFRCIYEVVGTHGVIEVPDAYLPPEKPIARLRTRVGENSLEPDREQTLSFDGRNQYAAMVDAFHEAVKNGRVESPSEDGLNQMKTLDAVLASARKGRS